jgi:hypothetical protein
VVRVTVAQERRKASEPLHRRAGDAPTAADPGSLKEIPTGKTLCAVVFPFVGLAHFFSFRQVFLIL